MTFGNEVVSTRNTSKACTRRNNISANSLNVKKVMYDTTQTATKHNKTEVPLWKLQPLPRLQNMSIVQVRPWTPVYAGVLLNPPKLQCMSKTDGNSNRTIINAYPHEQLPDKYRYIWQEMNSHSEKLCNVFRIENRKITLVGQTNGNAKFDKRNKTSMVFNNCNISRNFQEQNCNDQNGNIKTVSKTSDPMKGHKGEITTMIELGHTGTITRVYKDQLSAFQSSEISAHLNSKERSSSKEFLADGKNVPTGKWILGNLGLNKRNILPSGDYNKGTSVSGPGGQDTSVFDINANRTSATSYTGDIEDWKLDGTMRNHQYSEGAGTVRTGSHKVPPIFRGDCSAEEWKDDACQIYGTGPVIDGSGTGHHGDSTSRMEDSSFDQTLLKEQIKTLIEASDHGNTSNYMELNAEKMSNCIKNGEKTTVLATQEDSRQRHMKTGDMLSQDKSQEHLYAISHGNQNPSTDLQTYSTDTVQGDVLLGSVQEEGFCRCEDQTDLSTRCPHGLVCHSCKESTPCKCERMNLSKLLTPDHRIEQHRDGEPFLCDYCGLLMISDAGLYDEVKSPGNMNKFPLKSLGDQTASLMSFKVNQQKSAFYKVQTPEGKSIIYKLPTPDGESAFYKLPTPEGRSAFYKVQTPEGKSIVYKLPTHDKKYTSHKLPTPEGKSSYKLPTPERKSAFYKLPTPEGKSASHKAPTPEGKSASHKAPTPDGKSASHKAPTPDGKSASYKLPTPDGKSAFYKLPTPDGKSAFYKLPTPEGKSVSHKAPTPEGKSASYKLPTPDGKSAFYKLPTPEGKSVSHKAPTPEGKSASYKLPTPDGKSAFYKLPTPEGESASHKVPTPEGKSVSHKAPTPEGKSASYKLPTPDGKSAFYKLPTPEGKSVSHKAPTPEGKSASYKLPTPEGESASHKLPTPEGKSAFYKLPTPDGKSAFYKLPTPEGKSAFYKVQSPEGRSASNKLPTPDGKSVSYKLPTPEGKSAFYKVQSPEGKSTSFKLLTPNRKVNSFVLLSPDGKSTFYKLPTLLEKPTSSKPQQRVDRQNLSTSSETQRTDEVNPASPKLQMFDGKVTSFKQKRDGQHTVCKLQNTDDGKSTSFKTQSEHNLKPEFFEMHQLYGRCLPEENQEDSGSLQTCDVRTGSANEGHGLGTKPGHHGNRNCDKIPDEKQNESFNKNVERPLADLLVSLTEVHVKDSTGGSLSSDDMSRHSTLGEQDRYALLSPDKEDSNTTGLRCTAYRCRGIGAKSKRGLRSACTSHRCGRINLRRDLCSATEPNKGITCGRIYTKNSVHFSTLSDIQLSFKQRNKQGANLLKSLTTSQMYGKKRRQPVGDHLMKFGKRFRGAMKDTTCDAPNHSKSNEEQTKNGRSVWNSLSSGQMDGCHGVKSNVMGFSNRTPGMLGLSKFTRSGDNSLCDVSHSVLDRNISNKFMEIVPKSNNHIQRERQLSQRRLAASTTEVGSSMVMEPSDPKSHMIVREPKGSDPGSSKVRELRGSDCGHSIVDELGVSDVGSSMVGEPKWSDAGSRMVGEPKWSGAGSSMVVEPRGSDPGSSMVGEPKWSDAGSRMVGEPKWSGAGSSMVVEPRGSDPGSSMVGEPKWSDAGLSMVVEPRESDPGSSMVGKPKWSDAGSSMVGEPKWSSAGSSMVGEHRGSDPGSSMVGEPKWSDAGSSMAGEPKWSDAGSSMVGEPKWSDAGSSMVRESRGSDTGPCIVGEPRGSDPGPCIVGEPRGSDSGRDVTEKMMLHQTGSLLDRGVEDICRTRYLDRGSQLSCTQTTQSTSKPLSGDPLHPTNVAVSAIQFQDSHTKHLRASQDEHIVLDSGCQNHDMDTSVMKKMYTQNADLDIFSKKDEQSCHYRSSVNDKPSASHDGKKTSSCDFFNSIIKHDRRVLIAQVQQLCMRSEKVISFLDDAFLEKCRQDGLDMSSFHTCRGLSHHKRAPRSSYIGQKIVYTKLRIITILKQKLRPTLIRKLQQRVETSRREKLARAYERYTKQRKQDTVSSLNRKNWRKQTKGSLKSAFGLVNMIQRRIRAQKNPIESDRKCTGNSFIPQDTASQIFQALGKVQVTNTVLSEKVTGHHLQTIGQSVVTEDQIVTGSHLVTCGLEGTQTVVDSHLVTDSGLEGTQKVVDSHLVTCGLEGTQKVVDSHLVTDSGLVGTQKVVDSHLVTDSGLEGTQTVVDSHLVTDSGLVGTQKVVDSHLVTDSGLKGTQKVVDSHLVTDSGLAGTQKVVDSHLVTDSGLEGTQKVVNSHLVTGGLEGTQKVVDSHLVTDSGLVGTQKVVDSHLVTDSGLEGLEGTQKVVDSHLVSTTQIDHLMALADGGLQDKFDGLPIKECHQCSSIERKCMTSRGVPTTGEVVNSIYPYKPECGCTAVNAVTYPVCRLKQLTSNSPAQEYGHTDMCVDVAQDTTINEGGHPSLISVLNLALQHTQHSSDNCTGVTSGVTSGVHDSTSSSSTSNMCAEEIKHSHQVHSISKSRAGIQETEISSSWESMFNTLFSEFKDKLCDKRLTIYCGSGSQSGQEDIAYTPYAPVNRKQEISMAAEAEKMDYSFMQQILGLVNNAIDKNMDGSKTNSTADQDMTVSSTCGTIDNVSDFRKDVTSSVDFKGPADSLFHYSDISEDEMELQGTEEDRSSNPEDLEYMECLQYEV